MTNLVSLCCYAGAVSEILFGPWSVQPGYNLPMIVIMALLLVVGAVIDFCVIIRRNAEYIFEAHERRRRERRLQSRAHRWYGE